MNENYSHDHPNNHQIRNTNKFYYNSRRNPRLDRHLFSVGLVYVFVYNSLFFEELNLFLSVYFDLIYKIVNSFFLDW